MPSSPVVAIPEGQNREAETFERRGNADTILRSRVSEKKSTLPAIHPPQRKQQQQQQEAGAPKVPKLLSPKTPKTVLNRQKQLAIANRRSLHFVQDVLLMAQYFGGVLATVLVGYGTGAAFTAYSSGNNLFWANTVVAALLLGVLYYSYRRFVRPTDYLIHAGLSYACAVQRAIVKTQESEGKTPLELPVPHPNHPLPYLRTYYVNYVMGYMRFVLFTQPVLLFAAGLAVLGTAAFHNKWYIWSIGACFATMGSLWFLAVWTLYIWLKRKARRTSSQISAFFTEFLPAKPETQKQESANTNAMHPHTE